LQQEQLVKRKEKKMSIFTDKFLITAKLILQAISQPVVIIIGETATNFMI